MAGEVSQTRTIEVFRPGTFTPVGGSPISFSADDLRALAAAYDAAAAPMPAVVGHPAMDAPAYGWATALRYDDAADRLLADLGEVEPAFAEAVGAGRYKRVSLALFGPTHPANPKPGSWYPKHIGFLGAAAPAVSGLKPVAFAADPEDTVIEFGGIEGAALRDIATIFRGLRDFVIEKFGLETADRAMPGWSIRWIEEAAAEPSPAFAAPAEPDLPEPIQELSMTTKPAAAPSADDLARRQSELDARERAIHHRDHVAFAETLIGEGRILPVSKDKLVGLLDSLAPVGGQVMEVAFAADGGTKTSPALDLVKDILSAQPKTVTFGAADLGRAPEDLAEFAVPAGMSADPASAVLHAKAIAWQAAHPGIDYMAAVAAVQG